MSADLAALFPLDRTLPEPRESWSLDEIMPVLRDLQERGLLTRVTPYRTGVLPGHLWAVSVGDRLVAWGCRRENVTTAVALFGAALSPDAARKAAAEITAWCEARQ